MTWLGVLLVTGVVWAISVIRSVRLRAFVYSLPLPMTLAIVSVRPQVTGAQLLGVVGLNLFLVSVALLYARFGWSIVLADAVGIVVYVLFSLAVQQGEPVPFLPALSGVLLLWLACRLWLRRTPEPDRVLAPPSGLPTLLKPVVIFAGALVTALLGTALRGMVVTFPYSGVLTAIETRHNLPLFARHFSQNSLALVAFLSGYYVVRDEPLPIALLVAWLMFAATAVLLYAPRWFRQRRTSRDGVPADLSEPPEPEDLKMIRPSRGDGTSAGPGCPQPGLEAIRTARGAAEG